MRKYSKKLGSCCDCVLTKSGIHTQEGGICSLQKRNLVGGWATPLKNMSSSVGMMIIPNINGNHKIHGDQTTNQPWETWDWRDSNQNMATKPPTRNGIDWFTEILWRTWKPEISGWSRRTNFRRPLPSQLCRRCRSYGGWYLGKTSQEFRKVYRGSFLMPVTETFKDIKIEEVLCHHGHLQKPLHIKYKN